MAGPTSVLWYSSVAVQFLFCLHLLWTRLAKQYPIFTLYLGCAVLRSLGAMHYTVGVSGYLPISYTYFWLWTEPVLLLLQIGVALEVHAAMWRQYAGVVRSARAILLFSLLAALMFAAVPLKAEVSRFGTIRLQVVLQFELLVVRYISTVLAVLLVISALIYLFVVRSSLRSNLVRHEGMLAAYFGIYAIAYFVSNMGWIQVMQINNYMLSALTVCLVVWISLFRPDPRSGREALRPGGAVTPL